MEPLISPHIDGPLGVWVWGFLMDQNPEDSISVKDQTRLSHTTNYCKWTASTRSKTRGVSVKMSNTMHTVTFLLLLVRFPKMENCYTHIYIVFKKRAKVEPIRSRDDNTHVTDSSVNYLQNIKCGFNLPFIKYILNVFSATWALLAFNTNISL